MRVLVTAATKHGATADIATAIGEEIGRRGVEVDVRRPEDVRTTEGYEAVVLGSAVYAGHWLEPAKALVDRLGDELVARPVWLFSSGPVGDPLKPDDEPVDVAALRARTGARSHEVFAGRIDKALLGLGERAIVRALRVGEGDFRDWDAIRAWAAGIAESLASPHATTSGR